MNQTGGINSRQITIKVNETSYSTATNQTGWYGLSLNLPPVNNNATTYVITASFEDKVTPPLTATAWAKTLDGQQYPACITTQYGYKSAYNMTTLTISTQSTEVMMTTMSPEEMQKEAEGSGWLSVYNEFSWSYPWYRLHVDVNINPHVWMAFNPVLPGSEIHDFTHDIGDLIKDASWDVLIEYLVSEGIWRGVRMTGDLLAGAIAFAGATITDFVLLGLQWNDAKGLKATAISSIMCAFLDVRGLVENLMDSFEGLIDWFATLGTSVRALSGVAISLAGMAFDALDLIAQMVILGMSITRLIELGQFHS